MFHWKEMLYLFSHQHTDFLETIIIKIKIY